MVEASDISISVPMRLLVDNIGAFYEKLLSVSDGKYEVVALDFKECKVIDTANLQLVLSFDRILIANHSHLEIINLSEELLNQFSLLGTKNDLNVRR